MVFDEIICASDDERFMLEALKEAAGAAEEGEVPVGAVVVKDGQIIARAHNMVETARRSSAHAEMIALEAAEAALGAKWLPGATMYVTLEPCSMCSGVTYMVAPGSHFAPSAASAASRAIISACADDLCAVSTMLCARAMICPSFTTTAPTGTSPSSAARAASFSASSMNLSSSLAHIISSKTIAEILYHKTL